MKLKCLGTADQNDCFLKQSPKKQSIKIVIKLKKINA